MSSSSENSQSQNQSKSKSRSRSKDKSQSQSSESSQSSEIKFKSKMENQQKGNILSINKFNNSKEILTQYNNNKNNKFKKTGKEGKDTNYLEMTDKENFNEYLEPDIDDQEFEDIMLEDKRTFKEYFYDALDDKQLFINTFSVQDNFKPKSLKIIVLVLDLILYCVINGLFYGDDIISEIYHIEGHDSFFGFVPRCLTNYIYCAVVGGIINVVIDLFFVQEKRMKTIFIREKKNIVNLKVQIAKLSKGIAVRYISFVFFVIVLFILLMFYLLCFNYVYPHTQGDWVKSCIFLLIIIQILSTLVALLQTCLRFLGFYFKNEKIFKLSKAID